MGSTRVGTVELAIPRLRQGSYFPSLLEPRRRHERALLAVVQEAYVHGVSTRNVDDLARALGLNGVSKDQVSRICKELDGKVHAFRSRPLSGGYPYLMLDATFEKVRENGRVGFMRNALSSVPKAAQLMVAATLGMENGTSVAAQASGTATITRSVSRTAPERIAGRVVLSQVFSVALRRARRIRPSLYSSES